MPNPNYKHERKSNRTLILLLAWLMLIFLCINLKLAPNVPLQGVSWWIITIPAWLPVILLIVIWVVMLIRALIEIAKDAYSNN